MSKSSWSIVYCGGLHRLQSKDSDLTKLQFTVHLEDALVANGAVMGTRWLYLAASAASVSDFSKNERRDIFGGAWFDCDWHDIVKDDVKDVPDDKK